MRGVSTADDIRRRRGSGRDMGIRGTGGINMKRLSYCWAIFFIFLPVFNAWGYSDDDCIRCHNTGSSDSTLNISVEQYLTSVHAGEIGCVDCHKGVTDQRHIRIPGTGTVDCSECHEQETLHGQDNKFPCYQCHTRHEVFRVSDTRASVYWKNLKGTCGKCHPKECETKTGLALLPSIYVVSHPKQDFAKTFDKGMCVGCHQGQAAHGEKLPVNNQSCYKCHIPLGQNEAFLGYIHTRTEWDEQPVSFIAGYINLVSLVLIVFVAGFMILKRKKSHKV